MASFNIIRMAPEVVRNCRILFVSLIANLKISARNESTGSTKKMKLIDAFDHLPSYK